MSGTCRVLPGHAVPGPTPRAGRDGRRSGRDVLPDPGPRRHRERGRAAYSALHARDPGRRIPRSGTSRREFRGHPRRQQVASSGPLLTLVKALAAIGLAKSSGRESRTRSSGAPPKTTTGRVTRFAVAGPEGVRTSVPSGAARRDRARRRAPGRGRRRSFSRAPRRDRGPDEDAWPKLRSFTLGATFREAFVATLSWLVGDGPPVRQRRGVADKPGLVLSRHGSDGAGGRAPPPRRSGTRRSRRPATASR